MEATASASEWQVRSLSAGEARSFGADTAGAVLVGIKAEGGSWAFGRVGGAHGVLGVAAKMAPGRQVIGLGGVAFAGIEPRFRSGESEVVSLASAWHSAEGDWLAAVRDSGALPTLAPGDTFQIGYAADTSAASQEGMATHVVAIDAGEGQSAESEQASGGQDLPLRYALHQNRPNPFGTVTTFRFELPKAERVTLEVLDVQGRRVAQVANALYPAGSHAVHWDGGTGRGRAAAGVYFYRTVAGAFVDRKKLVVLP
jgi:hypothetical protein